MNKIDVDYQNLVRDILENGFQKYDRTGTGTISVFGRTIRHSFKDGKFPLLTTKKMAWKTMVTELLWFLRGDTSVKYLVDNGCHIWDGDAYKKYKTTPIDDIKVEHKFKLPNFVSGEVLYKPNDYVHYTQQEFTNKIKTDDEFAKKFGELGPVYGKQWRSWSGASYVHPPSDKEESIEQQWYRMGHNSVANKTVDQIANVIHLLKTDPDSRRMIVNAWAVHDLENMVLPPCHMMFQFYTRELSDEERAKLMDKLYGIKNPEDRILPWHRGDIDAANIPTRAISLRWDQRSVDVGLGLPFNIASYALLLELVAKSVNMVPEEVIGDLGDCHIYNNHIDGLKEQLTRTPYELPSLNINTEFWPTESGECGVGPLDAAAIFKSFYDNNFCKCLLEEDIQLYNYQSHPSIKLPLSN